MASRALAPCARGPEDYVKVYGRILSQVKRAGDHPLAGRDVRSRARRLLGLAATWTARWRPAWRSCSEHAAKIDGVKISLLDQAPRDRDAAAASRAVRMYTGDDFDYPTTIRGDGERHCDALLGIFDVIAPAASAALQALDRGRPGPLRGDPRARRCPLSRHVFGAPTRFYKTGVVFAAYLNGHQSHFRMVGGLESARSVVHLGEQFVLIDAAGLLRDPEMAAVAHASASSPSPGSSSEGPAVALAPANHYKVDLRAIQFTLYEHLHVRAALRARALRAPLARGVRRRHRPVRTASSPR